MNKILTEQDFEYKPQSLTLKLKEMEEGRDQNVHLLCPQTGDVEPCISW